MLHFPPDSLPHICKQIRGQHPGHPVAQPLSGDVYKLVTAAALNFIRLPTDFGFMKVLSCTCFPSGVGNPSPGCVQECAIALVPRKGQFRAKLGPRGRRGPGGRAGPRASCHTACLYSRAMRRPDRLFGRQLGVYEQAITRKTTAGPANRRWIHFSAPARWSWRVSAYVKGSSWEGVGGC